MIAQSANGNRYNIKVGATFVGQTQLAQNLREAIRNLEKTSTITTKLKLKGGEEATRVLIKYKDVLGQVSEREKILTKDGKTLSDTIVKTSSAVNDIRSTFGRLNKETETNVSATGRLITRTKEYRDGVLECVNVTQQWTNTNGQLVTQVDKLDANGKKLADTQTKITQSTHNSTTEINKYVDAQGREITEITKLNAQRDGEVERIIKAKTAEGGLITTTEKLRVYRGQELEQTREATHVIERNTQATQENTNAQQNLGNAFKQQLGAIDDFVSTMGKVIKFQIITKIITGFTTACREAVQVVTEFDSALTEFKKVSDLSGDALDSYTQKLGELGEAVARTRKHLLCENV